MATWQTPLGARVEILVADSPAPRVPPHPGCHCVRWALKPARFPSWLQFILLLASCPQAWGGCCTRRLCTSQSWQKGQKLSPSCPGRKRLASFLARTLHAGHAAVTNRRQGEAADVCQEMKRQCAVFAAPPRAFANTFSSFFLASYVHMSARGAPRRAAIGSRSRSRSRSQLRDVRVQL